MFGMCTCCNGECLIFFDQFNRPGPDSLGPDWCEAPGSWRIEFSESKAVSVIGGAPALVNRPHPTPDGSMIAQFFISYNQLEDLPGEGDPNLPFPTPSGQKWRLIVNSQNREMVDNGGAQPVTYCAPGSHYFAEVELISSTQYALRLGMTVWSSGAYTESILKSRTYTYDPLTEHPPFGAPMTVRIADNELCVHLGVMYESCGYVDTAPDPGDDGLVWLSVAHPGLFNDGYYCGMQMSQAEMYVTNFSWRHHFKTVVEAPTVRNPCPELNDHPSCDHCFCTCGNEVVGDVEILPDIINYRIRPAPGSTSCAYLVDLNNNHCTGQLVLDSQNARWIHALSAGKRRTICCSGPQEFIVAFHCPAIFADDPQQCARWYLRISGGGQLPPAGDKPGTVGGCCLVGGSIMGSQEECIIVDTLCNWERTAATCRSWTFCYPSMGCHCPKLPDTEDPPPRPPGEPPPPPPEPCYICIDIWW